MEFNIRIAASAPDIDAIEHAIRAIDPSAQVDLDPRDHTLRVAASIDAAELISLISQAGYPVAPHQVARAASICCGGCSG